MKKVFLLVFVFLVLVSPVFAISTDLVESYDRGETVIVEISGNILNPILPEDIELRRAHVLVPLDYDVKRLEDRYFLWLIAPNTEGEYRLIIKDVLTTVEGKSEEIDFEQNFSVSGDLVNYSIKPGLIFTQEDFSFTIDLNEDFDREIVVQNETVTLEPGENKIEFSTDDFEGAKLNFISIGKYEVPAYVIGEKRTVRVTPRVNVSDNVTIDDNVSDGEIVVPVPEEGEINYECSELSGGEKCSATEICDGEIVLALDGNCCVGTCREPREEAEGGGAFIGIIIIAIVLVIALFIWYRYKKAKPKKSLVEKAKGVP